MTLAAVNSTGYNIVLLLHILTAFVAFAPAFVHPLLGAQMEKAGLSERGTVLGFMVQNGTRVYATSLIVSGLLGFGVAGMSDEVFKMSQGWLIAAFIIWVAMNGLLHGGILPAERAVAASGTTGDAAAEKKLQISGMMVTLLFLVELYVMIFKPGLG